MIWAFEKNKKYSYGKPKKYYVEPEPCPYCKQPLIIEKNNWGFYFCHWCGNKLPA